jgi:hypothetical protein
VTNTRGRSTRTTSTVEGIGCCSDDDDDDDEPTEAVTVLSTYGWLKNLYVKEKRDDSIGSAQYEEEPYKML